MKLLRRLRWQCLLGVLLAAVGAPAFAVTPGSLAWTIMSATENMSLQASTGAVTVADGVKGGSLISRAYSAGTAGAVIATENYAATVGGSSIVMTAARGLTVASVANAAALAYGAGYVGFNNIGAPLALALGHDQFSIGATRCTATNSGWQCDAGTPPVTMQSYVIANAVGGTDRGVDRASICAGPGFNYTGGGGPRTAHYEPGRFSYGACVSDYNGNAYGFQLDPNPSKACPASVDALNPAWSKQAGASPGPDGKCPTGRYNGATNAQVADQISKYGVPTQMPNLAKDIVEVQGKPIATPDPATLSGPASATGQPTVENTTNPDGTTTTKTTTPKVNYQYNTAPNTISYNISNSTTTQTCTGANSCATTTTTTTAPAQKPDELKVCGLPGGAPCKIDETGTPTYTPADRAPIDAIVTADAQKRTELAAQVTDPGFGWLTVPPIAQCVPFDWPGSDKKLDPCGPIEDTRGIMGYVWALFGAFWSFGVIKKAQG